MFLHRHTVQISARVALRLADHSVSWFAQKTDINQSYRRRVSVSTKSPLTFVTFYYNAFIRPNVHTARLRDIFRKKKNIRPANHDPRRIMKFWRRELSYFLLKKNNVARRSLNVHLNIWGRSYFLSFSPCTICLSFHIGSEIASWNFYHTLTWFLLQRCYCKLPLSDVSNLKNGLRKFFKNRFIRLTYICTDVFRTILMSAKIVNVTVEWHRK